MRPIQTQQEAHPKKQKSPFWCEPEVRGGIYRSAHRIIHHNTAARGKCRGGCLACCFGGRRWFGPSATRFAENRRCAGGSRCAARGGPPSLRLPLLLRRSLLLLRELLGMSSALEEATSSHEAASGLGAAARLHGGAAAVAIAVMWVHAQKTGYRSRAQGEHGGAQRLERTFER